MRDMRRSDAMFEWYSVIMAGLGRRERELEVELELEVEVETVLVLFEGMRGCKRA